MRDEGSEAGAGPEALWASHNHPVFAPIPCLLGALLLLPLPQSLQVSQNSAASLSSSIFLQTNEELDPPSRLHWQAGCQLQWHLFLSEKLRRK